MPKLGCACGYIFDLSDIPCKDEYLIISDKRMMEAIEVYDNNPSTNGEEMYYLIREEEKRLYICPQCSRIYVEDKNDPNIFHPYISEELLYSKGVKYDL